MALTFTCGPDQTPPIPVHKALTHWHEVFETPT